MDLNAQECGVCGKLSEKITDSASLRGTGQECLGGTMYARSQSRISSDRTLSVEGHRASVQVLLPLFKESEPEKPSGLKCSESLHTTDQHSPSLSSRPATRNGKAKLRTIWRELATEYPDLNDRLATVARLIIAGECSLLPTPCKSDGKRWPGSPNHPRLQRSRGLRLQEELGARPGPEIVEWMMGFPIGWTDLKPSATVSSPKSPNGSDAES